MRLRPGERAAWIDASPWRDRWAGWRTEAQARGLGVDGLVSTWIEYRGLIEDLGRLGVGGAEGALESTAERELAEPRLAPTPPLRDWIGVLNGAARGGEYPDELPELMLPARLTQWPSPRRALGAEFEAAALELAFKAEIAAALRGLTVQAWGLEVAVRGVQAASE